MTKYGERAPTKATARVYESEGNSDSMRAINPPKLNIHDAKGN